MSSLTWREGCAAFAVGLLAVSWVAVPAAAVSAPVISGDLGADRAGYQLLLVTPEGSAQASTVAADGTFRLSPSRPTRGATLVVLNQAGQLVGPIVLGVDQTGAHTRLSGRAAKLGPLTWHADYAVAEAAPESYTDFVVRTAHGRPVGAGNHGLAPAATALPEAQPGLVEAQPGAVTPGAVTRGLVTPGGDADRDGLINLFDLDDDGDLIPDSRDSDPAVGPRMWTTVTFAPDRAVNAHTSDVTADQLTATLPASGLSVHTVMDSADLPGADPLAAGFVTCPAESWCAGSDALITPPENAGQFPALAWADYPGTTWTTAPDGSVTSASTAIAAPGWALHSTITKTTGPDGQVSAAAPRWSADLLPQPRSITGLPASGQVLLLNYRELGGTLAAVPLLLDEVLLTAPLLNEVSLGTISGDTLTSENGLIAATFWRPQAARADLAPGDLQPGDLALGDLGGLTYTVTLSDGQFQQTCPANRWSALTGLVSVDARLVDATGGQLPTATSNPLGFALDVAGCVADSQGALSLDGGQSLTLTLTAATGPGQASATAVSYRLLG